MNKTQPTPKFAFGQTVVTRGLLFKLIDMGIDEFQVGATLTPLLAKHGQLEQGVLCDEDHKMNLRSLEQGERIFSAFEYRGQKIWIITEWDRSVTTCMIPEDY